MPRPLAIGLTVMSAMLILWTFYRWLSRTEDPRILIRNWIITLACAGILFVVLRQQPTREALHVPVLILVLAIILSIVWTPNIGALFAKPLTSMFDGGDEEIEPAPLYSVATNKIRKGEFQAATFEIKEQLMKFPNDFKGEHLLAELQAQHLNDLPGAQVTIERLIAQPDHPPQEIAFALNELADWHLKYAQDIEAARVTLQKIIDRFPDTETAHHAKQRIAHLGTTQWLLGAHDRPRIAVPKGPERLGLMKDQSSLARRAEDPVAQAEAYVEHLSANPTDHEAREKLAWIYAEHFQRVDLAVEQMEHLVQDPHAPPRQRIHCLNIIADMQIKFGKNLQGARAALQRIIDLNPTGASAETARHRIDRLPLELKGTEERQTIKMS